MKTERQASITMRQASIIMCIFYGIKFIFFCLGFVSAGKKRSYYVSSSLPLPTTVQIVRSSVFPFIGEV